MNRLTARWAPLALVVIVVAGVAATVQQTGPRGVGVVNIEIIMPQTPGYQEAQSTFDAEFGPAQEDLQAMIEQRDSLISEYERASVVLTPTARQEKENEIRQLQARIEQRGTDLQTRIQERERELMEPLEQRVKAVIDGLRAERNLGIIFDVATMPGIASVDQTLDLTPVVVRRLQQSQN